MSVIKFYTIRRAGREYVKPTATEIEIPSEQLSKPAANVAWVLASTVRDREGSDTLHVDCIISNKLLLQNQSTQWTVYQILNQGCWWLHCTKAEIARYLSGEPIAEAELRARYFAEQMRTLEAYGVADKPTSTNWKLPPLYLQPGTNTEESDQLRAMAYLENLASDIVRNGGDIDNMRGYRRVIKNGDRYFPNEQVQTGIDDVTRALFGR